MKTLIRPLGVALAVASLTIPIGIQPGQAQSIIAAPDGTGTVVTPDGQRFDITGGSLSDDGKNLFHSFAELGLSQGEIANFLSQPGTLNILSRVVGGNASVINGLLQVAGSNANLFLINPAGIVFGPEASLNVSGDFTATTATGIGFENGWFNAIGPNNYSNLTGSPNQFAFATPQPGSLLNAGTLAVDPGQNLRLLGGTILNTGTLSAPGGTITIAAVPGENTVHISQQGMALSLEIQALQNPPSPSNSLPFQPQSLPALLTDGGTLQQSTGVTVNPDGTLQLVGSNIPLPATPGTALISGTLNAAAIPNAPTAGTIDGLGDRVALIDATLDASGLGDGGTVRVGGEYKGAGPLPTATHTFVDSGSLINVDAGSQGKGGRAIVWADDTTHFFGTITARGGSQSGNGGFVETSGKNYLDVAGASIDASASNGNAGTWLLDPRNVTITGATAGGSFSGGNPNIFTPIADDATVDVADITTALGLGFNVRIETGTSGSQDGDITVATAINPGTVAGNLTLTLDAADDIVVNADIINGDTTATHIFNVDLLARGGDIITTGATISTAKMLIGGGTAQGGTVTFSAPNGNIAAGAVNTSASHLVGDAVGGTVTFTAGGDITAGAVNTSASTSMGDALGGTVSFTATGGNITSSGAIDASASIPVGGMGNATAGSVGFTASSGNITSSGTIDTSASISPGAFGNATAGDVAFNANGTISNNNIDASASARNISASASGGAVTFTDNDTIDAGTINTTATANDTSITSATANGGAVRLSAGSSPGSDITFNTINTAATAISTNSTNAIGGAVEILATGTVQGMGMLATGATIDTVGTTTNGSVTIQHDGGPDNVPFVIGDANQNGLQGTINNILTTGSFPVLASGGNAAGTPAGMTITSINLAPTLTLQPGASLPLSGGQQDRAFSFTLAGLLANSDVNDDNTSILIGSILAGTLSRNGVQLNAGDTILLTDMLVFTPPAGFSGNIDAFTLQSNDGVSFSALQTISFNVSATQGFGEDELPREKLPDLLDIQPDREIAERIFIAERRFTQEFEAYFGWSGTQTKTVEEIKEILREIERKTGVKPAIIYAAFFKPTLSLASSDDAAAQAQLTKTLPSGGKETLRAAASFDFSPQPTDVLELLLITGNDEPVQRVLPGIPRQDVERVTEQFVGMVTDPTRLRQRRYLKASRQLYEWLVAPLEANLQAAEIDNLVFIADQGLRSLPLAALHNGQGFILERYSVSLMPSISLTQTRHDDLAAVQVLAAGAAEFPGQGQTDLPAVPVEVDAIAGQLWPGRSVLNQQFSIENLKRTQTEPFGLIHLATHADFRSGPPENSYIQLWDRRVPPGALRELGLADEPTVELLTLSACRTALGDREAELGFAGLAVQTGAKSALGSLWSVNDEGTMGLMTSFYEQLKQAPIKAEALRQAQLAMIRGDVRLEDAALVTPGGRFPLPAALAKQLGDRGLSHPYYWSAFTMVGSPW